jgi:hypothetical protein
MGTFVKFYMTDRNGSLDAYIPNSTPDALNLAWNDAVNSKNVMFNLTDKNGSRLSVNISKVDMLVCVAWNGV